MKKRYAYIECYSKINEIPFSNPLIKYLGNNYIKKHIIKRFPFSIQEVSYAGKDGYHIKIPFINSFENEDNKYVSKFFQAFNRQLLKYDINIIILEERLKRYSHEVDNIILEGRRLGLIYINKILNIIKEEINILEKDIKYIIVDGSVSDTRYLLDNITENINSLILITNNPEKYEEKLQEIYENTGLAIETKGKDIHQGIEGHIIIQCNYNNEKLFYCYEENSILIDFLADIESINQIKAKRKSLKVISQIEPYYLEQKWNPDLLLGIILNEERILKTMYLYGYKDNSKIKINNILNKYPVNFHVY